MNPGKALPNSIDGLKADTMLFSKHGAYAPELGLSEYGGNYRCGELGVRAFFSGLMDRFPRSMFDGIKGIGRNRIPSKVFRTIVQAIAIVMARHKSFWAWSYERLKYQSMDTSKRRLSIDLDGYFLAKLILGFRNNWFSNHSWRKAISLRTNSVSKRTNTPKRAGFVIRAARNWLPDFFIHSLSI